MRIRPYIPNKDYKYVSKWIDNERTHAFWCANRFPYPITQQSFHDFLEKNAIDWTDSAYVATENSGQAVVLMKQGMIKNNSHKWRKS